MKHYNISYTDAIYSNFQCVSYTVGQGMQAMCCFDFYGVYHMFIASTHVCAYLSIQVMIALLCFLLQLGAARSATRRCRQSRRLVYFMQ